MLHWADGAGQRIAARGGGTKGHWGTPPTGLDGIVSLRRLDAVLEHAWGDMTATVQAGCPVQTLQATLAVEKLGDASMHVAILLTGMDGRERVRARLVLVAMNLHERRAVPIPQTMRERAAAFCANTN